MNNYNEEEDTEADSIMNKIVNGLSDGASILNQLISFLKQTETQTKTVFEKVPIVFNPGEEPDPFVPIPQVVGESNTKAKKRRADNAKKQKEYEESLNEEVEVENEIEGNM